MGKIAKEMYYYEPRVLVSGKYGQELSVDFILDIRKKLIEKYGERLQKVAIEYKKRKDGVKVTPFTEPRRRYYEEYRPEMDQIRIFFSRTDKLPQKEVFVWPDGKIDEFIFDVEKGEYVSQSKPTP